MNVIEIHGLAKTFGGAFGSKVEALRGVDLDVGAGEAFGLLGPNGAGKTTLVKILLGLVEPSSGDATLLGHPAGTPISRREVGYMPERRSYPGFLTAGQVLDLFGKLLGMDTATRRQRIDLVLEEVEMSAWRNQRVGGFSKGMQQRLALAQALLPDPKVLFLDEPTEGIDPLGRVSIRSILRRNLERGKTLFVNSHMLGEVELLCDRVAILVKGKVRRAGPLSSLRAPNPEYRLTLAGADEDGARQALTATGQEAESIPAPPGLTVWRLEVGDREELNQVLDSVRSSGLEIEEVQRVRASLEEVFVQTINDANEGGRGVGPGGIQTGGRDEAVEVSVATREADNE
ncbi:MAG: ATP-binding cassette domain-containing protein [Acidobacteria bacterium]|nr:ATP-binding cassette domain-containing protein [Acidobacteriota bacterium]